MVIFSQVSVLCTCINSIGMSFPGYQLYLNKIEGKGNLKSALKKTKWRGKVWESCEDCELSYAVRPSLSQNKTTKLQAQPANRAVQARGLELHLLRSPKESGILARESRGIPGLLASQPCIIDASRVPVRVCDSNRKRAGWEWYRRGVLRYEILKLNNNKTKLDSSWGSTPEADFWTPEHLCTYAHKGLLKPTGCSENTVCSASWTKGRETFISFTVYLLSLLQCLALKPYPYMYVHKLIPHTLNTHTIYI